MAKPFKHKKPAKPKEDRKVFVLMRLMRGYTTAEIADKAGLSRSCISKIRTRRTRYPQGLTIDRVLNALDMETKIFHKDPSKGEVDI